MIEQVWLRASASTAVDRLIVATDDTRILQAAESFGAEAMSTSAAHPSGTDRVAEVAERVGDGFEIVLNIQGDEPLLTPTSLDRLVEALLAAPQASMATLSEPIADADELFDPNTVKVVVAADGRALYFSRCPIPFHRGDAAGLRADFRQALHGRAQGLTGYRKHQGIYAYRRAVLLELARGAPTQLERDEGLEQLRALESGYVIQVAESDYRSRGVDTPEDLERVARILALGDA